MNKCIKCGNEFDGRFCPECGTEVGKELVCPDCGARLPVGTKFCNECGHAFTEGGAAAKAKPAAKSGYTLKQKLYVVLRYVPVMLIALFAVLNLILFSASVIDVNVLGDMGDELGEFGDMLGDAITAKSSASTSFGSFYSMTLMKAMVPGVTHALNAFVAFEAIAGIYAIVAVIVCMARSVRYRSGKTPELLGALPLAIYTVFIVLGIVTIAKIKGDNLEGALQPGAFAALMIVFPAIFALLTAAAPLVRKKLAANGGDAMDAALREAYRSDSLSAHGFGAKANKFATKLSWHKGAAVTVGVLIVTAIVLLSTLIPLGTEPVRVGKAEKIKLDDSKAQVEKTLGAPQRQSEDSYEYFAGGYGQMVKMREDIKKLQEGNDKLDDDDVLDAKKDALKKLLDIRSHKYLCVDFVDGKVSRVCLDADRTVTGDQKEKELEKCDIDTSNMSGYYYTDNEFILMGDPSGTRYSATYKDGSYILAVTDSNVTSEDRSIVWSNDFGKCKKVVRIENITLEQLRASDWFKAQPDGVVYVGSALIAYKGTMPENTSITVSEGITAIGENAFHRCPSLISITISNSVTSIGSGAFYGCSGLTSVTIGNSVTSIGNYAFGYCGGLMTVNWNATNCSSAGSIDFPIFKYCTALTTVNIGNNVTEIPSGAFYGCSGLTSVTIGNSVTSIGDRAFSGCNGLTSITIPDSVKSIDYDAFNSCYDLTSITYNGTKAQWNAISKDRYWKRSTGDFTIHCTDGDIAKENAG